MPGNNTTIAAASAMLDERSSNASPTAANETDAPLEHGVRLTQECLLYSFVFYTLILGTLCIVGLIGNLTSFVVFWKDKIKTSTSFLFQGLSLIDSLLLIAAFPIYCVKPFVEYTGHIKGYNHVEPYVLVYVFPIAFLFQTATIWVTVLVGVNRYIAVCKPYQASRLCTVAQARKQLAFVLLCVIIYNIPKFCEAKLETLTRDNRTVLTPVYIGLGQKPLYWIIYGNVFYMIFLLILPLLVLTILNVRLINALNAWKKKRAELQTMRQQQDNNVTFVLIIVVLVFTVCQAPALVNQILWNVLPDHARFCGGFQFYFQRISNMLVILNSSVNFLIYFLFNTRFRQVLLETICKKEYKTLRPITNNVTNNHKELEGTNETLL